MRVSSWMSPDPMSTAPGVAAADAGRVMHTYAIRHLPVVVHGRVLGMVSDRDVRGAIPGRTVADIMSSPAHTVGPDDTIEAAARLMLSRHISALPVVDGAGHLVGMLTTTDCLLASLTPADSAAG